jgi:hypothetical protein
MKFYRATLQSAHREYSNLIGFCRAGKRTGRDLKALEPRFSAHFPPARLARGAAIDYDPRQPHHAA